MKRSSLKKINILKVTVDKGLNFRDVYDVVPLMEQIRSSGRILEPLHVRADGEDHFTALKGNRRALAAQQLLADPECPPDLRKALENTEMFVYDGLDARETIEMMLDHGGQKPLERTEIIKAIWRLSAQMYSASDIIQIMYHQLAKFTGNAKKAYEASQLSGAARTEFLKTWLHGTVGNYILPAGAMGEYVREQVLLAELEGDRNLTDEEKASIEFKADRNAVRRLNSAKAKDKKGAGWAPDTGGVEFNKVLDELRADFKGLKEGNGSSGKKPSASDLETMADNCQSGLRLAYLAAAGKIDDKDRPKLEQMDTEMLRSGKIMSYLQTNMDRVSDPNVAALIRSIAVGTPKDVEAALASYLPVN